MKIKAGLLFLIFSLSLAESIAAPRCESTLEHTFSSPRPLIASPFALPRRQVRIRQPFLGLASGLPFLFSSRIFNDLVLSLSQGPEAIPYLNREIPARAVELISLWSSVPKLFLGRESHRSYSQQGPERSSHLGTYSRQDATEGYRTVNITMSQVGRWGAESLPLGHIQILNRGRRGEELHVQSSYPHLREAIEARLLSARQGFQPKIAEVGRLLIAPENVAHYAREAGVPLAIFRDLVFSRLLQVVSSYATNDVGYHQLVIQVNSVMKRYLKQKGIDIEKMDNLRIDPPAGSNGAKPEWIVFFTPGQIRLVEEQMMRSMISRVDEHFAARETQLEVSSIESAVLLRLGLIDRETLGTRNSDRAGVSQWLEFPAPADVALRTSYQRNFLRINSEGEIAVYNPQVLQRASGDRYRLVQFDQRFDGVIYPLTPQPSSFLEVFRRGE